MRGARCRHVQGHPRRPGLGGHRGDRYFYRKRNPAAIRTRELAADISITATGLNLLAFGGINLSVDGVAVDVAEKVAFKGFLLSDVSNFAGPHGRTRAHHLLSAAARSHADPAAAGRRSPLADLKVLREGPVDDDHLRFTTSASASRLTVKRITRSTPWN